MDILEQTMPTVAIKGCQEEITHIAFKASKKKLQALEKILAVSRQAVAQLN